jgi:hypothetical protein
MSLPNPLLSDGDIVLVQDKSYQFASLIWDIWSEDPLKAAIIRAILGCQSNMSFHRFSRIISVALGQYRVRFLISFHWELRKCY